MDEFVNCLCREFCFIADWIWVHLEKDIADKPCPAPPWLRCCMFLWRYKSELWLCFVDFMTMLAWYVYICAAYWNATRAFMILSAMSCFAGIIAGILSFAHFSAFERFNRSFAAGIMFFVSSETCIHSHWQKYSSPPSYMHIYYALYVLQYIDCIMSGHLNSHITTSQYHRILH